MLERSTSSETSSKLGEIKREVLSIHGRLRLLNSAELSEERTRLFTDLINVVRGQQGVEDEEVLKDEDIFQCIPDLHRLFAVEQLSLEKYWARHVIDANNPKRALREFPFYAGYIASSGFICYSLKAISTGEASNILYVGSGALPLNPILISRKSDLTIDNIERDKEAFDLSGVLIKAVNSDKRLRVINTDVVDFKDFDNYDVIILATLVGQDRADKMKIIEHVYGYMRQGSLLVVKSVNGLRQLLYPSVDTKDLERFNLQGFIQNNNEITNMLIFLRKV